MTEIFQGAITIFLFFFILGSLVLVHELGHFVTARLAGVRVLEFGIGFPPRAKVLRAKGETLYTLNWLPIGGFVKLEGEDGDEADDPRSFVRARLPVKLIILVAGVAMNLVTAFLIFTSSPGWRRRSSGLRFNDDPAGVAGGRRPVSKPGDAIVAIDGRTVRVLRRDQVLERSPSERRRDGQLTLEDRRRDAPARSRSRSGARRRSRPPWMRRASPEKGPLGISRAFESHFFGPYTGHDLPTRDRHRGAARRCAGSG